MQRSLHRSLNERVISGVCGGIAEYLGWDPTLVRVLFVLGAVLTQGAAIIGYIVLAIVMPRQEQVGPVTGETMRESLDDLGQRARELGEEVKGAFQRKPPASEEGQVRPARGTGGWVFGLILIVVGGIFLLNNLRLFAWWRFGQLWPLILVAIGIALLLRRREG